MYLLSTLTSLFILNQCTVIDEPEGAAHAIHETCNTPLQSELIYGVYHDVCCDDGCHQVDNIEFDMIAWVCCDEDDERRRLSPLILDRWNHWPLAYVPYEIDATFSSTMNNRIQNAIDHIHSKTVVRFGKRTSDEDWLYFIKEDPIGVGDCSSSVGWQGGIQQIKLTNTCGKGSIIHEIVHALGFQHTQSREDRDDYVNIKWKNIPSDWESEYAKAEDSEYDDCLTYDYGSIMHYPATLKGKTVIDTVIPFFPIGQRDSLSTIDKACINSLYSPCRVALFRNEFEGGHEYSPYGEGKYDKDTLESLEFENNKVSSMTMTSDVYTLCRVWLYENNDYSGWSVLIEEDTMDGNDQYGWVSTYHYDLSALESYGFVDNELSAMKIIQYPACSVTLYKHAHLNGDAYGPYRAFITPWYKGNLKARGGFENNAVSSLSVTILPNRTCTVQLYEDEAVDTLMSTISIDNIFTGTTITYQLRQSTLTNSYSFVNDAMSSMKVSVTEITSTDTLGSRTDVSCYTESGDQSGKSQGSKSTASCNTGYQLVSCGVLSNKHYIDGTYVSSAGCVAVMGADGSSGDYVRAKARCCKLDSSANCQRSVSSISGTTGGDETSVTCSSNEALTGCTSKTSNRRMNGNYPGNHVPGSQVEIPDLEICYAQNGDEGDGVYGYGQCCSYSNNNFKLYCGYKAGAKSGHGNGALSTVTCPGAWFLTGCSGFSEEKSLKGWWISGDECNAKNKDGGSGVYAIAICCQERMGATYTPAKQVEGDFVDNVNVNNHYNSYSIYDHEKVFGMSSFRLVTFLSGIFIGLLICFNVFFICKLGKYNNKNSIKYSVVYDEQCSV